MSTDVPQGLVLGPKLFSLYTDGLAAELETDNVKVVINADGAYVICSTECEALLVKDMEGTMMQHIQWLRHQGMIINASKTEVLYLNKSENICLNVEGSELMSGDTIMVLVVEFYLNLSWEPQMCCVKTSCKNMRPALRSLRSKLSRKEFLQVVKSYYYPRLYYGSELLPFKIGTR